MYNEAKVTRKLMMLKKRMNDRLQHDPRITEISVSFDEWAATREISVTVTRIDGEKQVSEYAFATNAYELASLARIDAARFASKIDITRAFEIENERRAADMLAAFNGIEKGITVTVNDRPGTWRVIDRDYASKLVRVENENRAVWVEADRVTPVEPMPTAEEQAEADAALAALETVAARQDERTHAEKNIDRLVADGELSKAVKLAADTITAPAKFVPAFDNRLEGGAVTRHYYAVRTVHGTLGVECATVADAMKLAADRLDEINSQRREHGTLAPLSVQVDTRITVKLVGGGSEDFPIDKIIVTPQNIARIRARQ